MTGNTCLHMITCEMFNKIPVEGSRGGVRGVVRLRID